MTSQESDSVHSNCLLRDTHTPEAWRKGDRQGKEEISDHKEEQIGLSVHPMAVSPVGSATWRDASYKTVQTAQNLMSSALATCATGQGRTGAQDEDLQVKFANKQKCTPPPFMRDLIIQTCNEYALGYMRETQSSVFLLRKTLLEINRHIHRLQKDRAILEQDLANTRKDILIASKMTQLRTTRPASEKHPDKVDQLLQEEKKGLQDVKRRSERQLQEISRQIKVLESHQQKLAELCKEQGRVLDVVGEKGRLQPIGVDADGIRRFRSPVNADCQAAIRSALAASEKLKCAHPFNWPKPSDRQELKERVTKGLLKKAEESSDIREDVTLTLGCMRNMVLRQQRIHDEIETSYQLHQGPVSNRDQLVRDRLDRPLMRVLQRHPATQAPEGRLLLQDAASLRESLRKADHMLDLMHSTQVKLREDQWNKLHGEQIDRAAVRLRAQSARCRSDRLCL